MGPAGIWTALYPPRPSSGSRVRFIIKHHIVFISSFSTHLTVFNLQYSICFIESIKYLYSHWFFSFWFFQSVLWVLYFGMEYEYGLWYFYRCILWYSDDTCSVQGGCPPPQWSRAPRQESRTSRSIMWTHVLVLELHICVQLSKISVC